MTFPNFGLGYAVTSGGEILVRRRPAPPLLSFPPHIGTPYTWEAPIVDGFINPELSELRRRALMAEEPTERRRYADELRERYGVELEFHAHPSVVGERPLVLFTPIGNDVRAGDIYSFFATPTVGCISLLQYLALTVALVAWTRYRARTLAERM